MTKMSERDRAAELLGERISIDKLLTDGVQVNPPLDDEDLVELTRSIRLADGRLNAMPVIVSARGRLFEGHHRLGIIRDRHGRKMISPDEVVVDWSVTDGEGEALAGVRAQNARRRGSGAVRAHQCRFLMSTFGWSQGVVASKLGVQRPQVSRWLKDFPDAGAEFVIPDVRFGLDERSVHSVRQATVIPIPEPATPVAEPEPAPASGPPKPKAIRSRPTVASEVTKVTNRYRAELTNPEFLEWLVREHDPAEQEALFLAWDAISDAVTNIKWSLEPDGWEDGEPPWSAPDELFEPAADEPIDEFEGYDWSNPDHVMDAWKQVSLPDDEYAALIRRLRAGPEPAGELLAQWFAAGRPTVSGDAAGEPVEASGDGATLGSFAESFEAMTAQEQDGFGRFVESFCELRGWTEPGLAEICPVCATSVGVWCVGQGLRVKDLHPERGVRALDWFMLHYRAVPGEATVEPQERRSNVGPTLTTEEIAAIEWEPLPTMVGECPTCDVPDGKPCLSTRTGALAKSTHKARYDDGCAGHQAWVGGDGVVNRGEWVAGVDGKTMRLANTIACPECGVAAGAWCRNEDGLVKLHYHRGRRPNA